MDPSRAGPDGGAPEISIVAPCFNEVQSLPAFYGRVTDALAGESYELVIVDDGSHDGSLALLRELATGDARLRPLALSRNFGHQAAVSAGIDHARGRAVVTIDADLQDPPEVIPQLLREWRAGADVVHGVRHVRPGEPRLRLAGIRLFYRVFSALTRLPTFPGNTGDFRLIGGPALIALRALPERNRFVRGLVSWVGFDQRTVVYEREARRAGTSKYPVRRLVGLGLNGIVSFSSVPLRLAALLGAICSVTAFIAIPVVIVLRVLDLYQVSGIASAHILILLIGGLQLLVLGVFGEYLGRAYDEVKGRPAYVVGDDPG